MAVSNQTIADFPSYTTAEKIKALDKAIMDLTLGGQSVTLGTNTITRAGLDSLREYRKELAAQLIDEQAAAVGQDSTTMNIGFGQPH